MQSNLHSTNITPLKQLNNNTKTSTSDWRDTLNGVSRQFYSPLASSIAYAVIFGYRRVIFATRVLWRIEYHCEAKPNNITARRAISLFAKQRISLIKMQKRESFTELYFRITLSSVFIASFAFVKQIHQDMPIPLLKFSDKDYIHWREVFCVSNRLLAGSEPSKRLPSEVLL